MKKTSTPLTIFLLSVCIIYNKSDARLQNIAQDSSEIVKISQQLMDAIAPGDTTVWERYLHPDCIIRTEDGRLSRKVEMVGEIRPLPKGYEGTIEVTDPLVTHQGNTYVLSFIADEHLRLYGQTIHATYAEMNTFTKSQDGWQLLSMEMFELFSDPARATVKEDILKSYTGTYQLADSVQYRVFYESNKLMGQRTGRPAVDLNPETDSVFFLPGQRGRKIFVRDEHGEVVKLIDRRNGNDLVWTKARQ